MAGSFIERRRVVLLNWASMCARPQFFFHFVLPILLIGSSPAHAVVFHGTVVAPLGAATVSIEPASGHLVVSNIGSSGADGFELLTALCDGARLSWPAPAPLPGRAMRFGVTTNLPGIEPYLVVTTNPTGGAEILADFSSTGADGHIVAVFSSGVSIGQTYIPLGSSLTSDISPSSFDAWVRVYASGDAGAAAPIPLPMLRVRMPAPTIFSSPDGPIGPGDELRIFPSNATETIAELQKVVVLCSVPGGSEPDAVAFDDCAQIMFGREHRATLLGEIIKDTTDGKLFHVPAGAEGGLRLLMSRNESTLAIHRDIRRSAVSGDTEALSVTGQRFDGVVTELARVTGMFDGLSWLLTPNFAGGGSPDALVQLFDPQGLPITPPLLVSASIQVGSSAFPVEVAVDDRTGLSIAYGYETPVGVTLPEGTFLASRIVMMSNAPATHDFFVHADHEVSSPAGISVVILGEPNGLRVPDGGFHSSAEGTLQYMREVDACDCFEIVDLGPGGGEFTFRPFVAQDQFGLEWLPDPLPGLVVQWKESELCWATRLATDAAPVERMGIRMVSDGVSVSLYAVPRQTPKTDFGTVMKMGASPVVEFVHSSETEPFAVLPAWPLAVGYQVLHHPDQTWSMWINLGQPMDIVIPDGPPGGNATAQVVTADFIHLVFLDTPITSPIEESMLVERSFNRSHRLLRGTKTRAVPVGSMRSPTGPALRAPYPNPFNPSTTLAFELAAPGDVTVRIYSVRGQHVATLYSGRLAAGPHTMTWDGADHRGRRAASGVYIAELRSPGGTSRTKLNLLK